MDASVVPAPFSQRRDDWREALTQGAQVVFNMTRLFGDYRSGDHSVSLQTPELPGHCSTVNPGELLADGIKPVGSGPNKPEHVGLPATAKPIYGQNHRAIVPTPGEAPVAHRPDPMNRAPSRQS